MTDETPPPEGTPPPKPKLTPANGDKPKGYGVLKTDAHVCGPGCNHGDKTPAGDASKAATTDTDIKPHAHDDHCTHNEVKRVPAPKLTGWEARFGEFKKNVKSRFVDGIDPTHIIDDGHGNTKPFTFELRHKTGAMVGVFCSLGAVIHGGVNIMRGVAGYEDSLQEKHGPSAVTTVVGAGEIVGGTSFLLRALSGRYRI